MMFPTAEIDRGGVLLELGGSPETDGPTGIFDSGFGGLGVARAIFERLPAESVCYLADSARWPYGSRPLAQVREYSLAGLDLLAAAGVKALVIASGTAGAAVLRDARERYDMPILDVVSPAVRAAVQATRSGRIGLMCTERTAASGPYQDALSVFPRLQVTVQPCSQLVAFTELGLIRGDELDAAVDRCLEPLRAARVDTLILGCTHVSWLSDLIAKHVGGHVSVVSSSQEVATELGARLASRGTARPMSAAPPVHRFLTTGNPRTFAQVGARLLGDRLPGVTGVQITNAAPGHAPAVDGRRTR